jgi:large subunit ribosomal protein L24
MKIKKGDKVKMLIGKDGGKSGKVLKIFPREGKLTVEGLNLVKKHKRPRREGEKGQRIEIPRKIDTSNVQLICSKCGQATKATYELKGEEKMRKCKKCKGEI